MEIEIGVDFAQAEKEVAEARQPAPEGDYTVQVEQITPGTGKESGRPKLNWQLTIVGHPEWSGKKVFYNTSLPWMKDGRLETSGINFLVDLCKALGQPWTGGKLMTESYIGRTCKARLAVRQDQNGNPQNEVKALY